MSIAAVTSPACASSAPLRLARVGEAEGAEAGVGAAAEGAEVVVFVVGREAGGVVVGAAGLAVGVEGAEVVGLVGAEGLVLGALVGQHREDPHKGSMWPSCQARHRPNAGRLGQRELGSAATQTAACSTLGSRQSATGCC